VNGVLDAVATEQLHAGNGEWSAKQTGKSENRLEKGR
jgi:hypothetical protein